MNTPTPTWDTVHFISSYYDGPIEGLADFRGATHLFFMHEEIMRKVPIHPDNRIQEDGAASVDEDDFDYEIDRIYSLHPIDDAFVADLTEKHEIFERWHRAYSADKSLMKDHPALPGDRQRYQQLKGLLEPRLEALRRSKPTLLKMGQAAGGRRPIDPGSSRWKSFDIQWSDPPAEAPAD